MKQFVTVIALASASPALSAPHWTADIGMVGSEMPDRPGSRQSSLFLLPIVSLTYGDRLSASIDDGLRWSGIMGKGFQIGPVAEYRMRDRVRQAEVFPGMGDAVELGLFAQVDTPIAVIESRVRRAVTGYGGFSADLSINSGGEIRPGTMLGIEARAGWADYRFVASRFGSSARVRPTRELFVGPQYLTAGIQLSGSQHIAGRMSLIAAVSEDRLIGSLQSPLIRNRWARQTSIGVRWHFGD
jgi:outer membrane scaffolding protein for murein synthesis (MipA/OmpV family)